MATIHQARGALLEEVILSFLSFSGYRTVREAGSDPTLNDGSSGLEVKGRGGLHQLDAVADFTVGQPFSNPQRLLVEAKAYQDHRAVGLPTIRNAVGVIKDVSEFWTSRSAHSPASRRHHYQYSLFSTSDFTKPAQEYAFAQDIFLVPLRGSSFFSPIAAALNDTANTLPTNRDGSLRGITIRQLRHQFRDVLEQGPYPFLPGQVDFRRLRDSINQVGQALMATIARSFPVLLVPRTPELLAGLHTVENVVISWDDSGWYLRRTDDQVHLFSFDLPRELFQLYADQGVLTPARALDLKAETLAEIQAVHTVGNTTRLLTFRLDTEWLARVRERLTQRES